MKQVLAKSRRWWSTVPLSQRSKIRPVFGEMPNVEDNWQSLTDGPAWAWWLLAILPLSPQLQVGILGTTSLEKRLRAIEKTLDHMEQRLLGSSSLESSSSSQETTTGDSICRDDSSNGTTMDTMTTTSTRTIRRPRAIVPSIPMIQGT